MNKFWSKALVSNREGIHPSIPILLKFHPNLLNIKTMTNNYSGSALNIAMFANLPQLFEYLLNQPDIDLDLVEMEKFEKETKLSKTQVHDFKHLLKRKK